MGPDRPLRVITFGSNHSFTEEALKLVEGLSWVEHLDHVRTFDEREYLRSPNSAAALELLARLQPDLYVSAGYGRILGADALSIPRIGAINVHPSLLPDYRGYEAVSWALYEGHRQVGVTVHEMTLPVDGGPILAQRAVSVSPNEQPGHVYPRLAALVPDLLQEALERIWRTQTLQGTPQSTDGSYRAKPQRELDRLTIDWGLPAAELVRRSRIFGGWINIATGRLRLRIDHMSETGETQAAAGTVLRRGIRTIVAAAGDGRAVRARLVRRALPAWALLMLTHPVRLKLSRASPPADDASGGDGSGSLLAGRGRGSA